MKKYRVAHIHNDKKFIRLGDILLSPEFDNKTIFIGDKGDYAGMPNSDISLFEKDKMSVAKIVAACKEMDFVIFYSIDEIATKIILALPKKVKIGWRFFGFELYDKHREKYISDSTKMVINEGLKLNESYLSMIKGKFRFLLKAYKNQLFLKSISRCDVFFGLYQEEYLMLKKVYPNLPHFIPVAMNIGYLESKPMIEIQKEKYFLVGNSRNIWNNHFDILEIVNRNTNGGNYKATLLVNYGHRGYYYKKLLEFAKSIVNVVLIEDYMTLDNFDELYIKCAALVINSKRQLAVYNIRKALEHGGKVYLNEDNSYYKYLKNNNFLVFNIQEFEADFSTGNLLLDKDSAQYNYNQLIALSNKNSVKIFRNNILDFLKSPIKS
jgi:hypothetical protein